MKKIMIFLAAAALLFSCETENTGGGEPIVPGAEISIETEQLNFLPSGEPVEGNSEVTVTSSSDWRLTGKKTWCTPSAVAGKSGDAVTFTAEENTTEQERTITYTFFCGDKAVRFVVTQQPNRVFEVAQDQWEIPAEGAQKVKIALESSTAVTAQIEEAARGWIIPMGTRSITSYLYYTISANDTYAARTGHVTVSCEGFAPRVITISQQKNNAIKPSEESYKLTEDATELKMTVWSNIAYEVQIPDDATWLTLRAQPEDRDTWSSQELIFDISGSGFRAAPVKMVAKDNSTTISVAVQLGEPKVFQVPDKAFREDLINLGYIVASGNGYQTTAAGLGATKLDIYKLYAKGGCFSAEGVENFPNLITFDCRFSRLRSLDLSQNTKIVGDLGSANTTPIALETLKVGPGVTSILFPSRMYDHYSGSSSMSRYYAQSFAVQGEGITTIDVSGNRLQTIDVSECPSLTTLKCIQASGYTLQTITLAESQRGKVSIDFAGARLIYK